MNKDRIIGVAVFGTLAVIFFVTASMKVLQPPGFRLWDALGGISLGIAFAGLIFGWGYVKRNLGIEYLVARMRSR